MANKKGIDTNTVILIIVVVLLIALVWGVFFKAPAEEDAVVGEGALGAMGPGVAGGEGGVGPEVGADVSGKESTSSGEEGLGQTAPGLSGGETDARDEKQCVCGCYSNKDTNKGREGKEAIPIGRKLCPEPYNPEGECNDYKVYTACPNPKVSDSDKCNGYASYGSPPEMLLGELIGCERIPK